MRLDETDKLLTLVQNLDNREIDDAKVQLWHKLLLDVSFADSAEAVRRHFTTSSEYLMPIHVLRGAQAVAAERVTAEVAAQLEERPVWDVPGSGRQRGALVISHMLRELGRARVRMGGVLTQDVASDVCVQAVHDALAELRTVASRRYPTYTGYPCGRAGCSCTHTDGCHNGWIEVAPPRQPDPVIFGEQPAPLEDNAGRLAPCPTCRPINVEVIAAAAGRRSAQATLRLRRLKR